MRPIVFLHIPKTAGQTVHNALQDLVGGPSYVSPIRTHTQASPERQLAPGYRLYSGHLDWTYLHQIEDRPFAFSVLRDPCERLASFYLYLRAQAEQLTRAELERPENLGKRTIRENSVDDYFFGGDPNWQAFIRDHYDNFYCSYFATRRVRGRNELSRLTAEEAVSRANEGVRQLSKVYLMSQLGELEDDLATMTGHRPVIATRRDNSGPTEDGTSRWKLLVSMLEKSGSEAKLRMFVDRDDLFLSRLKNLSGG